MGFRNQEGNFYEIAGNAHVSILFQELIPVKTDIFQDILDERTFSVNSYARSPRIHADGERYRIIHTFF